MFKRSARYLIAGGMLLLVASSAAAQNYNPYAANPYSRPTVSPYLNLGVTGDGLSNYPTLVRPLIEDQKAIMHQAAHIQHLEHQLRQAQGGSTGGPGRDPRSGVAAGDRFMNLSHFYRAKPTGEGDETGNLRR